MDERTALHIAANAGASDVVSCLLMAKPNLDKVSTDPTFCRHYILELYFKIKANNGQIM